MSKRILFRVDANSKIGWGHFCRSLALARMLQEDNHISFAMSKPSAEIMSELQRHGFDLIETAEFNYDYPDDRNSGDEITFDLQDHLDETEVVVLDGYWFGHSYQKALRRHPVRIIAIEDNGKGTFFADVIINHAPGISQKTYKTDNPDAVFALGPDYALIRPSFLEAARRKRAIKKKIKQVVICFGGSDNHDLTGKYAHWFLDNTPYEVHAITGASRSITLEQMATRNKNLKISSGLDEQGMLEAFNNADLGVVPSSGLLYEAIACRLPVISGYYTNNQQSIYNGFSKLNVFYDHGYLKELKPELLTSNILLEDNAEMVGNHIKYIDGESRNRFLSLFLYLSQ